MDEQRAHIIATARAEAERMRTAVASAEPDAKVHMSKVQFAKLAELIDGLCDLIGGDEPELQERLQAPHDGASLGEMEALLLTAEAAFARADRRLHLATRDRSAAIEAINSNQSAIDRLLQTLRDRSPEGSFWFQPNRSVLTLDTQFNANEAALITSPPADQDGGPDLDDNRARSVEELHRKESAA